MAPERNFIIQKVKEWSKVLTNHPYHPSQVNQITQIVVLPKILRRASTMGRRVHSTARHGHPTDTVESVEAPTWMPGSCSLGGRRSWRSGQKKIPKCFLRKEIPANFFYYYNYYESRKRELKTRLIYEDRCDERLKARVKLRNLHDSHTLGCDIPVVIHT